MMGVLGFGIIGMMLPGFDKAMFSWIPDGILDLGSTSCALAR